MSPAIFTHRSAKPTPEVDAPWPGTAIAGSPQTVTLNGYASVDGKKLMGTWQSTRVPGRSTMIPGNTATCSRATA